MPIYNKLVHDKIPAVLEGKQLTYNTKILEDHTYKQELINKLAEECQEYQAANNNEEAAEELADILEVVIALGKTHGYTEAQLLSVRKQKRNNRGGFENKVYLIDVKDN
ncbi:nucleoside triphosphate pyrophosphohydrolase [Gracilibacillus oryzae]|uniref:Nucleoside triphosphate pyrophosphohydrolase n=1 Tax=Gracilibacillus oryzae TaxID=1672701 RepID=A0A7C8GSH5_9BACI|nr:nucleoside triphosphate pyrophosphohydrolase [Gracilibacillus oryzae]KAB8130508.1 nucleoside triphosphate pyrophosphohydrolase [Gracilibacillus oryzae]